MRRTPPLGPALAFALAATSAGPAAALSCLAPDPARAFLAAQEAPERFVVVLGELSLEAPLGRVVSADPSPGARSAPGRVRGEALAADGRFASAFDAPVTVTATCAGPWCGGAAEGRQVLFLEVAEEGGYLLLAEPCGGRAFDAAPEVVGTISACMAGAGCRPGGY
ncbi:hypothetical protein [Hasllibacter halocynthiae]|nr:hypothetical protein [Hasllibacter halocynthiae]